ncbi:MAG: ATP-binding cassette domain-containing protein [Lachnospiraceae bacterium]|nr:ATP-binding cassette domain-containing protein [Lachnospiraceae bacterium]
MLLETVNLSKKYGKKYAVDNVNIHIEKGTIYGLIGPNGAGKTTIMKMITGFASPTGGTIVFEDGDFDPSRIGVLIEAPGLYDNLTAFENMKVKAIALGLYNPEKIKEILEFVGLEPASRKKTKAFSLGMKQRLGIALAIIGNPEFLVLDEPINGLDPQGISELRNLFIRLKEERGMSILISSHILEELGKVADRFGVINFGHMICEVSAEELKDKCDSKVEIITGNPQGASVVLEKMGIIKYSIISDNTIYVFEGLDRTEEMITNLVRSDVLISSCRIVGISIEDYYLDLIGKDGANK